MTDDEIRDFVFRLEGAAEFRAARSHVEELEINDYLRIRANREACFSLAAAFLMEAIEAKERSALVMASCQTFEGHDQVMCGLSSRMIADIQLFSDWDNLEVVLRRERRNDQARDGISLVGCALLTCAVLIPAAGFIAWLLGQI